jgi:hypothetical protein
VPVLGQATADQGKDPRGEVFTVIPRQDDRPDNLSSGSRT